MVFLRSDIGFFLSGGTSNTDINASLGNAISNTSISTGLSNNLFPDTTVQQSLSGITKYRCFYVKNLNGTQMLDNPKIWILSNTISPFDEIDIAIGTAGKNGTENPIASETTAPSNVTFTHPSSEVVALALPDLNPGDYIAIWARISTQAGASPLDQNACLIRVRGTPV